MSGLQFLPLLSYQGKNIETLEWIYKKIGILSETYTAWKVSTYGVISGLYLVWMQENTDQK